MGIVIACWTWIKGCDHSPGTQPQSASAAQGAHAAQPWQPKLPHKCSVKKRTARSTARRAAIAAAETAVGLPKMHDTARNSEIETSFFMTTD